MYDYRCSKKYGTYHSLHRGAYICWGHNYHFLWIIEWLSTFTYLTGKFFVIGLNSMVNWRVYTPMVRMSIVKLFQDNNMNIVFVGIHSVDNQTEFLLQLNSSSACFEWNISSDFKRGLQVTCNDTSRDNWKPDEVEHVYQESKGIFPWCKFLTIKV